MGTSDILDGLIGIAWAFFGLPFLRWAWLVSAHIFDPLQSNPRLWVRCVVWILLALLYVVGFSALGVVLRLDLPPSKLSWNPMAGGVLLGLVLLVFALRGKQAKNQKKDMIH
jgi:hypothetical protein